MRFIGWIVGLALGIVFVVFAVRNRVQAEVDLWPSPFVIEVPLYVLVLGGLAVGILAGGAFVWLGQGRWRRTARRQRRTLTRLEREQPPKTGATSATTLPAQVGGD